MDKIKLESTNIFVTRTAFGAFTNVKFNSALPTKGLNGSDFII